MKKSFKTNYTDKNDGTKVKTKVTVHQVDLTKDLGNKFLFIETKHEEPEQSTILEEISIPLKDVKKLIKILKGFTK